METWLNVAEKPSVAKEMAIVLSERRHNVVRTLSQFNPVFEFPFQLDNGKRVEMIVTSVCGHLMEIDFPSESRRWSAIPFSHLFDCPIERKVKPSLDNVRKNLVALGKKATKVVLWLDCDREGENICFEVLDVVRSAKPSIGVGRAHFSALTKRDLFRAVNTTTSPNKFLSDAVDARQELDLRIGAAFTRFQTMRLRDHFPSIASAVLSMGPCQFPTLGFIVRRYWERLSFQKESLFTATMSYDSSTFRWSRGPVYDMLSAALIFEEMMLSAGPTQEAEVVRVDNRQQRRRPPVPLSTVALQKAASTHLRFSSERTMKLAEELYQQGYISYPRTETDGFTLTDQELQALAKNVSPDPTYSSYVDRLIGGDLYRRPIPGGHDDKAHPPIHPTKLLDSSAASPEKRQLYDLIVRTFLACMSKDAVGAQTTVVARYGGEEFSTSGHTVLEKNWFDIYTFERWSSTTIPNFVPRQRFVPSTVLLEEGQTEPPPLLSETLLISMMDSQGIGTDATIAQHIKTVQERKYVEVRSGRFIPTPLGIALVAAYEAIGAPELGRPALRAQMEIAMGHIAAGQVSKETVVAAGIAQYKALLFKAMAEEPQIDKMSKTMKCFHCGQVGHGIRECPTVMCRDCGNTGHIRNMCPLQTSGGDDDASTKRPREDADVRCGLCSKPGHISEKCSEFKCHDCGTLGHISRNCPKRQVDVKCFFCRKKGHTISGCEFKKRYPNDEQLCYLCLRPGHHASNCENDAVCHSCDAPGHISSECPSLECHNCHDKGHFERNCPDTRCFTCGAKGHQSSGCEVHPPRTLPDVPTTPIPQNGKVALIVDGEYFIRALCGEVPNFDHINRALQHVSRYVAEVFEMGVVGSWFCVDQQKVVQFLEESKVSGPPITHLKEMIAEQSSGLLSHMAPGMALSAFTAHETGCVSLGRYLTQDGVFSTAIQGGVDVALALHVANCCCSPHINQVVVLSGNDALAPALSPKNTRRPGMPPVRLCCVRVRDESDFAPFVKDYPAILLDQPSHDEGFRSVAFPAYSAFIQDA